MCARDKRTGGDKDVFVRRFLSSRREALIGAGFATAAYCVYGCGKATVVLYLLAYGVQVAGGATTREDTPFL